MKNITAVDLQALEEIGIIPGAEEDCITPEEIALIDALEKDLQEKSKTDSKRR